VRRSVSSFSWQFIGPAGTPRRAIRPARARAMSDSSDDEAPEEVSLGAVRPSSARLSVRDAALPPSPRAAAAAGVVR